MLYYYELKELLPKPVCYFVESELKIVGNNGFIPQRPVNKPVKILKR